MGRHKIVEGLLAWFVALGGVQLAHADFTYDTVALTGEVAPGMSGSKFSALGRPVLDNNGAVAFSGEVAENAARGVWYGIAGNLSVVARDGNAAPGIDGAAFMDFDEPILSGGGMLAFAARVEDATPSPVDNGAIWAGPPESLELVVRGGDPAPGVDAEFGDFTGGNVTNDLMTVNDQASVTLITLVGDRPADHRGIWAGGSGGVDLVALEDAHAPGTDKEFNFLGGRVVLNAMGSVGFAGILAGADSSHNVGIWLGPPGAVDLLVREGQIAPGTDGAKFSGPIVPSINAAGTAAFVSFAPLLATTAESGIWVGTSGDLAQLAFTGDAAPGTGGAVFDSFVTPLFEDRNIPLINGGDEVAFFAELETEDGMATPENNLGIWRGTPGAIELVARTGSAAPGTGGATFADLGVFAFNGKGDVAFTGVTSEGETGLWVDTGQQTTLIALESELFDVDPSDGTDLREIETLSFEGGSGGQDGRRIGLNDRRTVVFSLDFTDGTHGIFTAAIPEPSAWTLVAAGILVAISALRQWPGKRGDPEGLSLQRDLLTCRPRAPSDAG